MALLAYFHPREVLTTHLTEEQTHSASPPEHILGGDDGQQLQEAGARHCSKAAWLRISSICIIFGQQQKQKTKKGFLWCIFFFLYQLSLVLSRTEESFQALTAGGHCEGQLLRLPSH